MYHKKTTFKTRHSSLITRLQTVYIAHEKHRPFLEIFSFSPSNVDQKSLGTLFGIFSIDPKREDSAYIVNVLVSVIKKEYYSKPRRPASESFEATLKKVNLVLGEITKEGNTSWLGGLDGIICSTHNETMHFATCGLGKIYLIREKKLLTLNEEVPEDIPHPLKTFRDIASGKIIANDTILVSDRQLCTIFTDEQIQKESSHYKGEDFFRLLRTALLNECSFAGMLLAHIEKDIAPSPIHKSTSPSPEIQEKNQLPNVFNSTTFTSKKRKASSSQENILANKETPEIQERKNLEYIDTKTGHIYIQQEDTKETKNISKNETLLRIKDFFEDFVDFLTTHLHSLKKKTQKIGDKYLSKKKENPSHHPSEKTFETPSATTPVNEKIKNLHSSLQKYDFSSSFSLFFRKISSYAKNILFFGKILFEKTTPFLPNRFRIKKLFLSMKYEQKVISLLIIFCIIVLPLISIRLTKNSPPDTTPLQENILSEENSTLHFWEDQWEQEKNAQIFEKQTDFLYETSSFLKNNPLEIFFWNNTFIFVQENSVAVFSPENNTNNLYAPEIGSAKITSATFMNDLNLLFFLTDTKKLYAWSPIDLSFSENALPPIEINRPHIIGSFLTYLYLYDSDTKNILRFPRIAGGFDEPVSWLKEDIALENPQFWTVSGNIFLANTSEIHTFFQGKKVSLNLSETFVPLVFNDIFTSEDQDNLFILDSQNGRLAIASNQTGNISRHIVSEEFISAKKIIGLDENILFVENASGNILKIPISQ
ncbi:MAG: hypothetical protein EOM19_00570 [Candidatus Moranbacteria bacterium]|nr:hypothetical protein [Candidatus Moranbacteria bacterium]